MTEEEKQLRDKLYDLSHELWKESNHQTISLEHAINSTKAQLASTEATLESTKRSNKILGEMIGIVGKLIRPS